ncbi:centromere protein I [Cynoglossus semilaevis]|uniref:centromere protein I n=1 Tax=Cynoglossus semilaevis TaxID=244447 RepID=UPI000495CF71|nr:centromere protein I [Cynoglossus semilaevis]
MAEQQSRSLISEPDSLSSRSLNRSLRIFEKERRKKEEDPFVVAISYFRDVKAGTPILGNDELGKNLALVEKVAFNTGLPPEAIAVMLEFAMSLRMGSGPCVRVLKCLIPNSVVPQHAVLRAVVLLTIGKLPISTQVLFLKWILTMFDMIDAKDELRAIYGIIFSLVTEENLCPYVCHLLYLLTRKENVQVYRVRKLLELQSKLGRQPFLLHLLSLYKVFCPELVKLHVFSSLQIEFKNHNSPWKSALMAVQKRNGSQVACSSLPFTLANKSNVRKRKHIHLQFPAVNSVMNRDASCNNKLVPLQQINSFSELLKNLHRIELPAQMGSLLTSGVALHYLYCVQSESALLRLNFWLGFALQEDFLFCSDGKGFQESEEAVEFLDKLLSAQHFLQESFASTEVFLYKFLTVWDGSLFRPQIFSLLSQIPVIPSSKIKEILLQPLAQLFFTSSVVFKCEVIECLNSMLSSWLIWHMVNVREDELDITLSSHSTINMSLSGFMDSVLELIQFVGHISSVGLQFESSSTLLLRFILDFYETVCDTYLKFGLPLIVMPPPGVFYQALFSIDPVSVDHLAFIMFRYKENLTAAKTQEKAPENAFHISRQTFHEFNHYLQVLVNCLWNSKLIHPKTGLQLREELLAETKIPDYRRSFDLVHHPAFLSYAVDFHQRCWPEKELDLGCIKTFQFWSWYLQYLYSQGYDGLQRIVPLS